MICKSGRAQKNSVRSGTRRINQGGYLLPLAFILFLTLIASALSIMAVIAAKYSKTGRDAYVANAVYVAEAGVSDTISQLGANPSFAGFTTKKQFYNNGDKGKAEYTTTVTGSAATTFNIDATGYIYRTASDATPYLTKRIKVQAKKSKVPMRENFIAGSGGLEFAPQATMTGGNVYVKGRVTMAQNTRIGATADLANLYVGNVGCGDAITWPQSCGAGSPPLTMNTLSGNEAQIYGSVCATDQVSATGVNPGTGGAGLRVGCVTPTMTATPFDKQTFVATMDAGNKKTGSTYACAATGGTVTIPAGTWVVGDVNITSNGSSDCNLVIGGNVYIEGSLIIGNYGRLKISDSVTLTPKIILSGQYKIANSFAGSTSVFQANSAGVSGYLISFYSSNVACSKSVDAPSKTVSGCLTAGEAKTSATLPGWGNLVDGAVICSGASPQDVSGAVIYAYYGVVNCSWGGLKTNALAGQGILAGTSSVITLLPSAVDNPFADYLSIGIYVISDYQQVY